MGSTLLCLICKQRVINRHRKPISLSIRWLSRLLLRHYSSRADQFGGSKDNYRLRPPQWYRDCIRGLNN